ncbi:hypothetical protein F7725_002352 [Dissostichus mawsoni]|uniref:Uncharacterized protein n=1 Tax=Dissostichus mawsoni TaxID=36200 RepID=A0A7J5Y357_DISMA|nr:hypothetical protein F7725_002352 [Dissostichus mawsoni]
MHTRLHEGSWIQDITTLFCVCVCVLLCKTTLGVPSLPTPSLFIPRLEGKCDAALQLWWLDCLSVIVF